MGPEQEQSEEELKQDQHQLDLNNLPDNPGNEGPPGLTQETRRSEANKGRAKPRLKSSPKKSGGINRRSNFQRLLCREAKPQYNTDN
ncbi:MAG: hypothetical protein EZS28_029629 [Streblomastix strix]|uniref:Uncharacterized protein n=1 Tax=Streblomastix strix TaxID=222440 RepID=A0A5J4UYJ7_9EUKA|nr:MAG: hypothetical protein EZS28_029629 [Streblomastix strix]